MSQIPPSPYGNQPPPPPPYGQPPMPPYGQGYPPQPFGMPGRTSGVAIASLVLGFVGFCVPLVGGLVAVILGIVGIAVTGKPSVKGRGLAITGLILGLLTTALWTLGAAGAFLMVRATAPDRATARQFMTDLSTGNATAAATECVAGDVPGRDPGGDRQAPTAGALADSTFFGINVNSSSVNGPAGTSTTTSTTIVGGSARFGTTMKSVQVTLVPGPGGKHLIQKWQIN